MLYTWYGDDFTGSTDVLETLALAGINAALFVAPPTAEQLEKFPMLQALGIAGDCRSRSPEWMSANLGDVFRAMKTFGAPLTHYKTCSTFDSAPHIGSIGRAMEIGIDAFGGPFVPIVVGAPHLGRYVVFGNLFATADGIVYRIDRHPTMSRHPVTPMLEADLRKHLALQTSLPIASVDLRDLTQQALDGALAGGASAALFDTFDHASLKSVGELLWQATQAAPLFAVGSSGLTESLIPAWQSRGLIDQSAPTSKPHAVEQIVVLSGSCSPVTAAQIEWATAHGFEGIRLDADHLIQSSQQCLDRALACLEAGGSPILYTAMGPLASSVKPRSDDLGKAMGHLLGAILGRSTIQRVVLCGGDTSSHAVQQLPIEALTWCASTTPGAPVCRVHSDNQRLNGLELVLKGGQIGSVDLFRVVKG